MGWEALQTAKAKPKPSDFFKSIKELPRLKGLKIVVYGDYATGKTYFGLSGPPPVYVIDTEFGAAKVAHFNFPDKDIRIYEVSVIDEQTGEADFSKSLERVEEATKALFDVKSGTIVIDSLTDIYHWLNTWTMRTASRKISKRTGEEYVERLAWQERNEKYYTILMRLLTLPTNVVATAKETRLYGEHGEELTYKGPKWHEQTPYYFDCVVHIVKFGTEEKFVGVLEKFRQKRALNVKIEDITMAKLAEKIKEVTGVEVDLYGASTS